MISDALKLYEAVVEDVINGNEVVAKTDKGEVPYKLHPVGRAFFFVRAERGQAGQRQDAPLATGFSSFPDLLPIPGGFDDIAKVIVTWFPVQHAFNLAIVCHQLGRVAGSPRSALDREIDA